MNAAAGWFHQHRKLVVFAAGALLTIAVQIWGTDNPYVSIAILAATGLGINQTPNRPPPGPAASPPVAKS